MKSHVYHLAQQLFSEVINGWFPVLLPMYFRISGYWRAYPNYLAAAGPNSSLRAFQNYFQMIRTR